jgi:hypothetical protein
MPAPALFRSRFRLLSFDVGVRNHACCLIEWRRPAKTCVGSDVLTTWWRHVSVLGWSVDDVTTKMSADGETTEVAKNVTKIPMHTLLQMLLNSIERMLSEWPALIIADSDTNAAIAFNEFEDPCEIDSDDIAIAIALSKDADKKAPLVDSIVVEQQPRFNPRMKMVSAALFAWCHLRFVSPAAQLGLDAVDLAFCSPSNKGDTMAQYCARRALVFEPKVAKPRAKKAVADADTDDEVVEKKKTKKAAKESSRRKAYVARKGESVFACTHWLDERTDTSLIEQFATSKKKDDLADAFWQAMYTLECLLTDVAKYEQKAVDKAKKARDKEKATAATKVSKPKTTTTAAVKRRRLAGSDSD